MALKDAFTKLGDAVADLSSLDVQSFSGTLTAKIQSKNDGNILDWKALVKEAKTNGEVQLRIASHFNVDGDAILFTSDGEVSQSVRTAHEEAVRMGKEIRKDLLDLFTDRVRNLF